jgi:pyrroloquinoline quinone biosynthesis protein D
VAPPPERTDADDRPEFARGVRLRRERDGTALLLVPEGIVRLNATAAATLELVDGHRTIDEIVAIMEARHVDVPRGRVAADVRELFGRLRARRLLR